MVDFLLGKSEVNPKLGLPGKDFPLVKADGPGVVPTIFRGKREGPLKGLAGIIAQYKCPGGLQAPNGIVPLQRGEHWETPGGGHHRVRAHEGGHIGFSPLLPSHERREKIRKKKKDVSDKEEGQRREEQARHESIRGR